jgi:hypothetical protein
MLVEEVRKKDGRGLLKSRRAPEFEALKADIAVKRIQVAVFQDEYGDTLDGHQRERAVGKGENSADEWHLCQPEILVGQKVMWL